MTEKQERLFGDELPEYVSNYDLCKVLGISRDRLCQHAKNGLPKESRGRYHLAKSTQWLINYWKTKDKSRNDNLSDQRRRLLTAQAKKAEIDNDEKLKQLIPIDIVSNVLNQVAVIVASQLDAMAPRLSNELTNQDDPANVKRIIEDETRQIRISVANLFDDIGISESRSDDHQAATDTDGQPVGRSGTHPSA